MLGSSKVSARSPIETHCVDVAVVGGGPAGLAAAVQLVRGGQSVCVLDSNRPRHAATLKSHGFITRDGMPPLELRARAAEDFKQYELAVHRQALVTGVGRLPAIEGAPRLEAARSEQVDDAQADDALWSVTAAGVRGGADQLVTAKRVLVTVGLTETLPGIAGIRAFYGTALHSCIECDLFEKRAQDLVLVADSPQATDLFERALQILPQAKTLTVCTNGSAPLTAWEEAELASLGVCVRREQVEELLLVDRMLHGIRLVGGGTVSCTAGFVRPEWCVPLDFMGSCREDVTDSRTGLVEADGTGETSLSGLYAAGDCVQGPGQVLIAAGHGASVGAQILRSLIGVKKTVGPAS